MKRTSMRVITMIFILGCATFPPPATAKVKKAEPVVQQQVDLQQLELQQMELRALVAEISILQTQLNDKIERARALQAQIQVEQMKMGPGGK